MGKKTAFFVINYTGGCDITEAESQTEIVLRGEGIANIIPLEDLEKMIETYKNFKGKLPEGGYLEEALFYQSQDNANGEQ